MVSLWICKYFLFCALHHLALISSSYYTGLFPASLPEAFSVEPHCTCCAAIRNALWNTHIVYTSVKIYVVLNSCVHSPQLAQAHICTAWEILVSGKCSYLTVFVLCNDGIAFQKKSGDKWFLRNKKEKPWGKVGDKSNFVCDSAPGLKTNNSITDSLASLRNVSSVRWSTGCVLKQHSFKLQHISFCHCRVGPKKCTNTTVQPVTHQIKFWITITNSAGACHHRMRPLLYK